MTLPDHYEPQSVEQHVKQLWSKRDAYERAKEARCDGEPFYFVDGPPFTSGRMHCGTAWGKVLKDTLLRYHRMQGCNIVARPGYDTHGLPVERRVEEKHGFTSKQDVEAFGVEAFVEECRNYVTEQREVMDEEFADLGVWMDWDDPYQTMDRDYMQVVWAAFKQLHSRGHVGRDRRIVNTCPDCETPVAETRLAYETREATEAYVGFRLSESDDWLVAWTTTPWTVTGNQFVAVDSEATYCRVSTGDRHLYVAEAAVNDVMDALGVKEYEVVETVPGDRLVGKHYTNPLSDALPDGSPAASGQVAHADYVDVDGNGTGLVHSAPGYGEEDFERGRELDLPAYSPVDETGTFTTNAGEYANLGVREAVTKVLADLEDNNALLASGPHKHEYPRCPRCDTQILYRAAEQWLVRVTEFKDELLSAVDETEWYPDSARENRFRKMVKRAPDWNVSRQRYWGTPVPVWTCEQCDHDVVVADPEELVRLGDVESAPEDLHRHKVDTITLNCPQCGGEAERDDDVLDVWFDSAVASWATEGACPPSKPEYWPANLIVEGHDQTRGWFLMQLYLGVALEGQAPFEEVLMHGFAQLDGEAMSKSRGHVLRPPTVINEHGRDPLRARLLTHNPQANDVNLSSDLEGVETLQQKLDVVWNVYRFALLYMDLDEHSPTPTVSTDATDRNLLDDWALSRLQSVVEAVTTSMEERRTDRALKTVLQFVTEDISRYYVQTVRDRVWDDGSRPVYDVLGTVMHAVSRLLAPFVPHLAERLYDSLDGDAETVHATDWPTVDETLLDEDLQQTVEHLRNVEEATAAARHSHGRKQRWPVSEVVVATSDEETASAVRRHSSFLDTRLNARDVRVTNEYDALQRRPVPQMNRLGPRYGELAPAVAEAIKSERVTDPPATVTVDGEEVTITEEMVEVTEVVPDDVVGEAFETGHVYVDMSLDREMQMDGLFRDVLRRTQELRAELDVGLTDEVEVAVSTEHALVREAVNTREDMLCREARATRVTDAADGGVTTTWDFDGEEVTVGVSRP